MLLTESQKIPIKPQLTCKSAPVKPSVAAAISTRVASRTGSPPSKSNLTDLMRHFRMESRSS